MKTIQLFIVLVFLIFSFALQGVGEYCLYFDGNDDYMEIPDITELNNVSQFTVSFWMKQDDNSTYDRVFHKIDDPSTEDISIATYQGKLYFEVGNGSNSFGYWNGYSASIPSGTWFHVAAVYDGTLTGNENRIKLFVDGVQRVMAFSGVNDIPATTYNFNGISEFVSFNNVATPQYFGGFIDELRVWDYARTGVEINNDMNAPLSVPQPGLIAYYKFDETAGQTAVNATGNSDLDGQLGSIFGDDINDPVWAGTGPTLPVVLSAFSALQVNNGNAELRWTTQTEIGLSGFNIYRGLSDSNDNQSLLNFSLIHPTNSSSVSNYTYIDVTIEIDTEYFYWLESVEINGTTQFYGPISILIEDGDEGPGTAVEHVQSRIGNVYPNPFNGNTSFNLFLEKDDQFAQVQIYNTKGQKLKEYSISQSGSHSLSWDGKDKNGNETNSGIYFIKMQSETNSQTKKIIKLK